MAEMLAAAAVGGTAIAPGAGRAGAIAGDGTTKPYKGLDSFQVEDGEFFYGRDREAEQLVAKILSARLTILHAQSGAGKTSLLNARIIPGLEELGWTAARVIPQNDPIRAVITTTLLHVYPPPAAERQAVETAWEHLGNPDSIGDLVRAYDDLEKASPLRRRLVAPIELTEELPWAEPGGVRLYPWFTRLLRSTVDLRRFSDHVTASSALSGCRPVDTIEPETPISEIMQVLTDLHGGYASLLQRFSPDERQFTRFFGDLVAGYQAHAPDFSIVILFDQAEELFTRFIDHPNRHQQTPRWQLKWDFFEQLEHLVGRPLAGDDASRLPVRFVISLRSEYLAQLDPVRSFAWDVDASSYHLGVLGRAQAISAITEPAGRFDFRITPRCSQAIVDELAREDRYVEPAQLQIVCDELWRAYWQAHPPGTSSLPQHREIDVDTLGQLGGSRGIVGSFLDKILGNLPTDERLDALELLEPLVTRSGTRNVVNREDLVDERFRQTARRVRLLKMLVGARILREERRLGGRFVELTHEFLIEPVLRQLKQLSLDAEYSRFRWALATLQQLAATGQDARGIGSLRIGEFLALHDNHARMVMNDWVREVMFRSAAALIHVIPEHRKPDEILRFWTQQVDKMGRVQVGLPDVLAKLDRGLLLEPAEMAMLNTSRSEHTLAATQLKAAFRSSMANATDAARADIEYWTSRMVAS